MHVYIYIYHNKELFKSVGSSLFLCLALDGLARCKVPRRVAGTLGQRKKLAKGLEFLWEAPGNVTVEGKISTCEVIYVSSSHISGTKTPEKEKTFRKFVTLGNISTSVDDCLPILAQVPPWKMPPAEI